MAFALFALSILLARQMGPNEFGIYGLLKQFANFLDPILLLPLGLPLVQNIVREQMIESKKAIFAASFLYTIVMVLTVCGILLLLNTNLTIANLNKNNLNSFFFYFICYSFFILNYNGLRGFLRISHSCVILFLGVGLMPLLISFVSSETKASKFFIYYGIILLISSCPAFLMLIDAKKIRFEKANLCHIRKLFVEGTPRSVAYVLYQANLLASPLILSLNGFFKEAGFFVIAQNIPKICESLTEGIYRAGVPLLTSKLLSDEKNKYLDLISQVIFLTALLGIFLMNILIINANSIVLLLYGADFSGAAFYLEVISASLPFFLVYTTNKTFLEASSKSYLNMICAIAALIGFVCIFVLLYSFLDLAVSLVLAFTGSFGLIGITSVYLIKKEYNVNFQNTSNTALLLYYFYGITLLMFFSGIKITSQKRCDELFLNIFNLSLFIVLAFVNFNKRKNT